MKRILRDTCILAALMILCVFTVSMAFIYVGIVLVMAYFVDAVRTRRDIEFINSKIKSKTVHVNKLLIHRYYNKRMSV